MTDRSEEGCVGPAVASQPATLPLAMVVAATPTGLIGRDGSMPWHLGTDLARFKRLTMGGTLIMGRKTFDSIGRPLPGRQTVVLTRDRSWAQAAVRTAASTADALQAAAQIGKPVFVVGGAQVYQQMLPHVSLVWMTRVWSATDGDTLLDWDGSGFRLEQLWRLPQSSKDSVPTELQKWVRLDG